MLQIFRTAEFWISLAVIVMLLIGMGRLKKYLKRLAEQCGKKRSDQDEQKD